MSKTAKPVTAGWIALLLLQVRQHRIEHAFCKACPGIIVEIGKSQWKPRLNDVELNNVLAAIFVFVATHDFCQGDAIQINANLIT